MPTDTLWSPFSTFTIVGLEMPARSAMIRWGSPRRSLASLMSRPSFLTDRLAEGGGKNLAGKVIIPFLYMKLVSKHVKLKSANRAALKARRIRC